MSSNMRLRELLLPLLMLPMILPALISCVEATGLVLDHEWGESLYPHLKMLAVYAIVFIALSLMLFEYAVEE
jgi:heme exporter protein B